MFCLACIQLNAHATAAPYPLPGAHRIASDCHPCLMNLEPHQGHVGFTKLYILSFELFLLLLLLLLLLLVSLSLSLSLSVNHTGRDRFALVTFEGGALLFYDAFACHK